MKPGNLKHQEVARRVMAAQRDLAMRSGNISTSKDDLIAIGGIIWPNSYRLTEDDGTAFANLTGALGSYAMPGLPGVTLEEALSLPNQQVLIMSAALWYHTGLHQIVLNHKFAAALMATKVNKDVIEDVQAPWRSFFISLPNKMIYIKGDGGRDVEVTGLLVAKMFHIDGTLRWAYTGLTESSLTLWRHGYTTQMLLDREMLDQDVASYDWKAFSETMEDMDMRATTMLGRIIVNTCLALNDPRNVQKKPKDEFSGPHSPVRRDKRGSPAIRTYILGRPNVVDCTQAVKDYLRTGKEGSGMTVQILVSGHFRSQPHGPQSSLRKVIWIEPFWKGDKNAPILVTPKILR